MDIIAQIKQKIEEHLNPKELKILDESSMHGNTQPSHLRVHIVSNDFEGLSSLQRHQKVHQAIGSSLLSQIHAFSQQTLTPKEWEQNLKPEATSPPCHRRKS